jgi:ABC-type lipoprotein export system ATPase subunit
VRRVWRLLSAIARAVVHAPGLILADEPTGNLDPATAARVLAVLRTQVRDAGAACLLVTHSAAAAAQADRVLTLTMSGIEDRSGDTASASLPAPLPSSGSGATAAPAPAGA